MKKTILALMIALTLSPALVSAQTLDANTQAQIEALVSRIVELKIQLIIMQIDELKAQLAQLIAQGQTDTSGTSGTTNTPAPVVSAPTPSVDMLTSCASGGPILDIDTNNLNYNQIQLQLTGFDAGGEYHNQRMLIRNADRHIDYMPAGTYQYSLTAYSGFTGPFTEGTAQDTRTVELTKSGELVLGPCN